MKTKHESMRGWFAYELYHQMKKNKNIFLIVGDLGYKVFDHHFKDFPERCINTGASEQSMLDIGVGLAMSGKIPVCYSITPFLLYRPFETIRTYINYEKIPVLLIGSGRDTDYKHDGYSHDASDDRIIMTTQENIYCYWPETKEDIPELLAQVIDEKAPAYINLKR